MEVRAVFNAEVDTKLVRLAVDTRPPGRTVAVIEDR